jgi:hypothetical protein
VGWAREHIDLRHRQWLCKGKARQGKARHGKARHGKARQGKARQGTARQGKVRQGKARQTSCSTTVTRAVCATSSSPLPVPTMASTNFTASACQSGTEQEKGAAIALSVHVGLRHIRSTGCKSATYPQQVVVMEPVEVVVASPTLTLPPDETRGAVWGEP